MRRKAIKLANLRTRITHSVQTDDSNYRSNISTQVGRAMILFSSLRCTIFIVHAFTLMLLLAVTGQANFIVESNLNVLFCFLTDHFSQVYLPKQKDTQTKREKGTSVPKPSVYIAGLRGCKSETTHAYKVDLTLDVNTHNDICD